MNYEIMQIGIEEYSKCNNIWNMKKCPFTDKFKEQIINGDRFVYIYKINNEFIGEGDLVINVDDFDYYIPNIRIYVSRMIVKREYRNQGIGGIILDYLIEQANAMGYKEMALGVDIDNYSAIHLYKKKGFTTLIKESEDEYGRFYKLLKEL
ncbi:MAG: GNAT family N-acetyltransferase [Eubacterium sp.]|nr:GNAT family N-acetyltransferase [Eubacterium sp.]